MIDNKLFIYPLSILLFTFLVWLGKRYITKFLDAKFDDLKADAKAREEEHVKKDEMIIRGLQTLSDCQYEVIYDLKNGEHNGGLDQCMDEIKAYRAEVKDWVTHRAAIRK